jgi:hypothetical protein
MVSVATPAFSLTLRKHADWVLTFSRGATCGLVQRAGTRSLASVIHGRPQTIVEGRSRPIID